MAERVEVIIDFCIPSTCISSRSRCWSGTAGRSPHETGWKDTVSVDRDEDVSVIARFEGYRGRYLLHCHNLEHEDHSMMARFDVV